MTKERQQAEQQWVREQFQKANKFLAEKGVVPGKVLDKESRILPPFLTLWLIQENTPRKRQYWVITGDLPSDMVEASQIKDAREALRQFSLTWQLKAEGILRSNPDKTQTDFAKLMISRAESMASMHMKDDLWGEMTV